MVNTENDAGARDFVTYLMERCLDGKGPRDELIELIGNWRERSSAPVQSRQVMDVSGDLKARHSGDGWRI
jgi:hypothetical protein